MSDPLHRNAIVRQDSASWARTLVCYLVLDPVVKLRLTGRYEAALEHAGFLDMQSSRNHYRG